MTTIEIPNGANLDPYFKANRRDTEFRMRSGVYYCESAWGYAAHDYTMMGEGCALVGCGSQRTCIVVRNESVPEAAWQIENLTAGSRSGASSFVELRGFTLVCAGAGRPKDRLAGQVGIHVWSDHARILDVEVRNVFGVRPTDAKNPSQEGFGVLLNGPGNRERCVGGSLVEDVRVFTGLPEVTDKSPNYMTGIYAGYVEPEEYTVVRNVSVVNHYSKMADVAFGVNSKVLGSGWTSQGRWGRGIYCDVCGGRDVLVGDSVFEVEQTGVEFQSSEWRDVTVMGCRFVVKPGNDPYAFGAGLVLVHRGIPTRFENVTLIGCVLEAKANGGAKFYTGSVTQGEAVNVGLRRCEMIGKWQGQSTNHPGFTVT